MTVSRENVYIIIPVHNRKAITLQCLDTLDKNGDLKKYYIIVVDDGSTDGTSEAIQSLYPDIIILAGDGNLWWTGAIKKGMEYAYEKGAEYFIWLNDDCYPHNGSIGRLVELCKSDCRIIAGCQCFDPDTLRFNYAGIVIKNNNIVEVSELGYRTLECDGISGHLACLPRLLIEDIGYPKPEFYPHYYGDHAYTHHAKKRGYKLLIHENAKAVSKNDHQIISWLDPKEPLLSYWQDYFKIGSTSYWRAELNYYREFFGFKGIVFFVYRKIIRFWLFFIFAKIIPLSWRQSLKKLKYGLKNDRSCL